MKRILIPSVLVLTLVAITVMGSTAAGASVNQASEWKTLLKMSAYSSNMAASSSGVGCVLHVPDMPDSECVASSKGVSVAVSEQGASSSNSISVGQSNGPETEITVDGQLKTLNIDHAVSLAAAEVFKGSSLGLALGHGKGVAKAVAKGQLDYTREYVNSKTGKVTTRTESEKVSAQAKARAKATSKAVAEDSHSRGGRPKCDVDKRNEYDEGRIWVKEKLVTFLIKVEAKAYVKACADSDAVSEEGGAGAAAFGSSESWTLAKLEVYYRDHGPYRPSNHKASSDQSSHESKVETNNENGKREKEIEKIMKEVNDRNHKARSNQSSHESKVETNNENGKREKEIEKIMKEVNDRLKDVDIEYVR